jgi:hypothetical protein
MKDRIKYLLDDPGVQTILDDMRMSIVAIIGGLIVVGAINGIYALCEWLKNLSI